MSIFADCYPSSCDETIAILATTSSRDHMELRDSCSRCGHLVLLHSEDRACSSCEQMNIMSSSFDPLLKRLERIEGAVRCDASYPNNPVYVCTRLEGHSGDHWAYSPIHSWKT